MHYEAVRKAVSSILHGYGHGPTKWLGSRTTAKANDFLRRIIGRAHPGEGKAEFLAETLHKTRLTALHISSKSPVHPAYELCESREYVAPLREENEGIMAEHRVLGKARTGKDARAEFLYDRESVLQPAAVE